MKKILHGGTIVTGTNSYSADILINNEKIVTIGREQKISQLADANTKVIDVSGKLLFPGFIDAHTHLDLHVAGTVTADNFTTGTKAAIKGGTTTIIDFATQYQGETLAQGLANWHKKADNKSSCDYSFHMSISEWNNDISKEIQDMMNKGITSFKLYMTYDTMVDDKTICEILQRLKEVGGITGVHCENNGIITALKENAVIKSPEDVSNHYKTRPDDAEAEAVNRLLTIANIVNIPIIIVHLTCKKAYDVIMRARSKGQKIYVETCPQYLLLDNEKYNLPHEESIKYVCAPPLRTKSDQNCLWQALSQGNIQTVSTDHCSFTTTQKSLGKDNFTKIPGGLPGIEHRGVLMYSCGVHSGYISKETMCRILSENPAKLYGLYPRKGIIAPGSDADIVVLDPNCSNVISAKEQLQNVDYTPYEGLHTFGKIDTVFLRGNEIVKNNKLILEKMGKFIKRKKYNL